MNACSRRWSRSTTSTSTNSSTPSVIQISWPRAKVLASGSAAWSARSMRWIIARPSPLSAATIGSSTGSAYGATSRTTTWQPRHRRGQPAAVARRCRRAPCPRRRGRPRRRRRCRRPGSSTSRNSSAPRRRRCMKPRSVGADVARMGAHGGGLDAVGRREPGSATPLGAVAVGDGLGVRPPRVPRGAAWRWLSACRSACSVGRRSARGRGRRRADAASAGQPADDVAGVGQGRRRRCRRGPARSGSPAAPRSSRRSSSSTWFIVEAGDVGLDAAEDRDASPSCSAT